MKLSQFRSQAVRLAPAAALLTAAVTLSGCTWFYRTPALQPDQAAPTTGTNEISQGSGNVGISDNEGNLTITGEDGDSAIQFGGKLPDNWPKDLPVPQSGNLVFAGAEKDGSQTTFTASFAVPGDPNQIASGLRSAYEAAGWDIGDEVSGTFGVTVNSFSGTKGGNEANVTILTGEPTATQTEGVSVTISAEYK